jgi:hypothetical protein
MANEMRVEGLQEVVESFRNADSLVAQVGKKWLRDWSIYGVKQVQLHTLNAGAVDTNELIQGIHYDIDRTLKGMKSTIKPSEKADKYALDVEEGTKPHYPPVKALQGWADRHGIPVWLVVRKIGLYGTEPRYMWRDGFGDLNQQVDKELSDFASEIVRKL